MQDVSSLSNEFGRWLHDRHWHRAARMSYALAAFMKRRNASAWFNRGLLAKIDARWADSLDFNRRATELDPGNMPAWWNLGIAATALGDWPTARRAWAGYGIDIPSGDGPPDMNLGAVPIRLSPRLNAEVVWARRIDPARAQILSVPLPASDRGHRDTILHDGAPRGTRLLEGREVSVFDELQVLEPGGFATFSARLTVPTPADLADLDEMASQCGAAVEDWSAVISLCAKCSAGTPHRHDEEPAETEWNASHQIGIAARTAGQSDAFIGEWLKRGPERHAGELTCVFSRS